MISLKLAQELNEIIAKSSGGSAGIRDTGSLLSALNRPFQTFGGEDLYPTALEKSAAIVESIIINHPFIDGNKRMGYAFMRLLLAEGGYTLKASEDEIYDFIISISEGKMKFEAIRDWIKNNI
ncbi:type II toxin-antitoxin system death-on-curing family toxin [Aequorivita echinoideorum]|uniref:type II toxin-antitoxin system death-on-curing family toxin n=1 Tax=Aequorivita echinoideorum TaxID=1549647 RepID=UPI001BDA8100|nr:type II toxin-antitoxin system death-on-curing family toxin [Aequorivita echinoideorum]